MTSSQTRFPKLRSGALILALTLPLSSSAMVGGKSLYVGAGLLSADVSRVTTSGSGSKSTLGAVLPSIGLIAPFEWFQIDASYTPLGRSGTSTHTKYFTLATPLRKTLGGFLDLKLGPGLIFCTVSGSGDIVTLNDGTSTSQFAAPGGSATSRLFLLDAGLGFAVGPFMHFGLDGYVTGLGSSRRAVNVLAQLGWGVL